MRFRAKAIEYNRENNLKLWFITIKINDPRPKKIINSLNSKFKYEFNTKE